MRTINFRNTCSLSAEQECNGMNYSHPITKNGKKTVYFRIMEAIVAEPGHTHLYYLEKAYGHHTSMGGMGRYFSILSHDGYIKNETRLGTIPTEDLILYVLINRK